MLPSSYPATKREPLKSNATLRAFVGLSGFIRKSTVASRLARKLGYANLESGAIYRALALKAIEWDTSFDDEAALAGPEHLGTGGTGVGDLPLGDDPQRAKIMLRRNDANVTSRIFNTRQIFPSAKSAVWSSCLGAVQCCDRASAISWANPARGGDRRGRDCDCSAAHNCCA